MKAKILSITAILLIVAGSFSACNNSEPEDVYTAPFAVTGINLSECGFFLSRYIGNSGIFHNRFVWAENLPKEYQKEGLRVNVTYRIVCRGSHTADDFVHIQTDCNYPIINIINIRRQ